MGSGHDLLKRVEAKIREIGVEDIYYSLLTPSQAALMLYGIAPPAPKETATLMRDIFVKKEKIFEDKWVKILEDAIQIRKEIEHGTKKELTGTELDKMVINSKEYLKRIKKLFTQIEIKKDEEAMVHIYDSAQTILRDALAVEGLKDIKEDELGITMEKNLIDTGKIPAKYIRVYNLITKAKKDFDAKKLTKLETEKVRKESAEFFKILVEHMQRARGSELERAKIRVKYKDKYGEVMLLDSHAFIIEDIDAKDKAISKAAIKEDGSLGTVSKTSLEDFEKHLATVTIPKKVFIKQPIFSDLKKIFGNDIEILVSW